MYQCEQEYIAYYLLEIRLKLYLSMLLFAVIFYQFYQGHSLNYQRVCENMDLCYLRIQNSFYFYKGSKLLVCTLICGSSQGQSQLIAISMVTTEYLTSGIGIFKIYDPFLPLYANLVYKSSMKYVNIAYIYLPILSHFIFFASSFFSQSTSICSSVYDTFGYIISYSTCAFFTFFLGLFFFFLCNALEISQSLSLSYYFYYTYGYLVNIWCGNSVMVNCCRMLKLALSFFRSRASNKPKEVNRTVYILYTLLYYSVIIYYKRKIIILTSSPLIIVDFYYYYFYIIPTTHAISNMKKYPQNLLIILLIAICFLEKVSACEFKPNQMPLIQAEPKLIGKVENGEKYLIGSLDDPHGNYIYVARMKGSAYEMGKAFGTLFKQQLKTQLDNFYGYYIAYFQQIIQSKGLPKFIVNFLSKDKSIKSYLDTIFDLNIVVTKRYTNKRYLQEIKGVAAGAGFGERDIERLNIFPQYVKAACTVAGIWGSASKDNHTLHMRALDWDSANPINKFPLLAIYHPNEKGTRKHVNIGYVGFIGVLTGLSQRVSIGEKVWLPPKHSVKMTRFGTPWTYVLRDVIYEAEDMKSAIQILTKAHRTCAIHLGVASLTDHNFRIFLYSENILQNFDDSNLTKYTSAHPKIKGVAYFDKHSQPSNDPCVGQLLSNSTYYQKWTMQSFWRVVGGSHPTGDTQLVVFDLEASKFLISYSRNIGNKTQKAYNRSPILVDMEPLWKSF